LVEFIGIDGDEYGFVERFKGILSLFIDRILFY
jgi:hypothetical protein